MTLWLVDVAFRLYPSDAPALSLSLSLSISTSVSLSFLPPFPDAGVGFVARRGHRGGEDPGHDDAIDPGLRPFQVRRRYYALRLVCDDHLFGSRLLIDITDWSLLIWVGQRPASE